MFAFSVVLYANTLGHRFALDDAIVITDNRLVRQGVAGWGELFRHDTFYGFFGEERQQLVAGGRYRPLTPALFALEYSLSSEPFLFHLMNVLWYGLLGVVLLGLLLEWWRDASLPWWAAWAAAALFIAHPVHTEAVANVKGRDEILALAGAAGAAWLVLRAARLASWGAASAGAMLFFLGCLAKENAVTFLGVIPVLVYTGGHRRLQYVVPVIVAAVAYLALRYSIVGGGLGAPSLEWMNNPFLRESADGTLSAMSIYERFPTVCYTAGHYLKLLFIPLGLVHDYYPAAIELKTWRDPGVWLSLGVHLVLLAWAAWHLRSRRPWAAAGILLYLMTLSVVSNLFFSVGTLMSERFLFMPSLGFAVVLVGVAARWRRGWWIAAVLLPVYTVLTVVRNPVWYDNYTLFTTDVGRQPNSAKLRNAAAGARLDRYHSLPEAERGDAADLLRLAREDVDAALRIHPRYGNTYLLRGNAAYLAGDYDSAIRDYENAAAYGVPAASVDRNLALALQQAGRVAGEERSDLPAAIGYLQRSLALDPNSYETLRLLGIAHGIAGRPQQAYDYFARAVEIAPDNEGARQNLEVARRQLQASSGR